MKKLILIILFALPLLSIAQNSPIDQLFEKYSNKKGVAVVNISGTLLGLAAKLDSDDEDLDLLQHLKGIRILSITDSTLNTDVNFFKELDGMNFFKKNHYQSLMEIKKDNEVVNFYGKEEKDGKYSQLVLIVGGQKNSLISISGSISPSEFSKIYGTLNQ